MSVPGRRNSGMISGLEARESKLRERSTVVGVEGSGDEQGSRQAEPCNSAKVSGISYSGGWGSDIFRYVFRKFLLTSRLGQRQYKQQGSPWKMLHQSGEEMMAMLSGLAIPSPALHL